MLARKGYAKVAMPGGCDIGARPIDFHVKGIQALGAHVNMDHGFVEAECERLKGAQVYLNFPSAGATQHIMTTACLAEGVTTIHNAAMEPEVVELASFLTKMGAQDRGRGHDHRAGRRRRRTARHRVRHRCRTGWKRELSRLRPR